MTMLGLQTISDGIAVDAESSYMQNDYGLVFMLTVLAWKPLLCVELGCLQGYSALHISAALTINEQHGNGAGQLFVHDLFEDYKFNSDSQVNVKQRLDDHMAAHNVSLVRGDAYKAAEQYKDNSVHLLHIDLSNCGKIVRDMIEMWHPKLQMQAIIMIEGGSKWRDKVDWMTKYDRESIYDEINRNPILNGKYQYGTYHQFPSLTVGIKKDD